MIELCILFLCVIAYGAYKVFAGASQAKLEQVQQSQFQLTNWSKTDQIGTTTIERVLSFPEMKLKTDVSDFSDGGYLADMYQFQSDSWKEHQEQLEKDGWTKEEWMHHGVQEFDVRRVSDGTWQGRPVWKRWKNSVLEAIGQSRWKYRLMRTDDDSLKRLTGLTQEEWATKGDLYNNELRAWETIVDDAPAIEASYQRFIHSR